MIQPRLATVVQHPENILVGGFLVTPHNHSLLVVYRRDVHEALVEFHFADDLLRQHQGSISPHINHDLPHILQGLVRGFTGGHGNIHFGLHAAHAEGDHEKGDQDEEHVHKRHQIVHRTLLNVLLRSEFHQASASQIGTNLTPDRCGSLRWWFSRALQIGWPQRQQQQR